MINKPTQFFLFLSAPSPVGLSSGWESNGTNSQWEGWKLELEVSIWALVHFWGFVWGDERRLRLRREAGFAGTSRPAKRRAGSPKRWREVAGCRQAEGKSGKSPVGGSMGVLASHPASTRLRLSFTTFPCVAALVPARWSWGVPCASPLLAGRSHFLTYKAPFCRPQPPGFGTIGH